MPRVTVPDGRSSPAHRWRRRTSPAEQPCSSNDIATWTPAQIKSALVNHADLVVKDAITGTHDVGPTAQGAGARNLSGMLPTQQLDGSGFGELRSVTVGRPTSVTITLNNPTGTDDVRCVDDKVYAEDVRRNGTKPH